MHLFVLFFIINQAFGEGKKENINEHSLNFYSGMFDYSDDGQKAILFGFQHENENLTRDSFLGTLSPVTVTIIKGDNASYLYTGIQTQYTIGKIDITKRFTTDV